MRRFAFGSLAASLGSIALAAGIAAPSLASDTRGYVVSWFYLVPAVQSADKDCPEGLNLTAEGNFKRWMKDMGKSPNEIEALMGDFPNTMYANIGMRGRIDGKPVSPYFNPTSLPDPMLKTVKGTQAFGFNLDGQSSTGGFTDPETKEAGVDNQLYRALGCVIAERGDPGTRPTYPSVQWDTDRQQMAAWLVEVSGIDDPRNDDDVTVEVFQATSPVVFNVRGEVQHDMTFQADGNPATRNKMHARLKDGVITTDPVDFHLTAHRYQVFPSVDLKKMRIRFAVSADGALKGVVGGYQNWLNLYSGFARGGVSYEVNVSLDIPGMYYALRKMADAAPDAAGQNTMISAGYNIEAVPAFIMHSALRAQAFEPRAFAAREATKTAEAK